jgi:hypothetical protein
MRSMVASPTSICIFWWGSGTMLRMVPLDPPYERGPRSIRAPNCRSFRSSRS